MRKMRKDTKGRNLYKNESQMKDGRYRYRYTDRCGERKSVYAWKLVPTDKTPRGKKEDISLREKEKQIQKDIDDGIVTYKSHFTVESLINQYLQTKNLLTLSSMENYQSIFRRLHNDSDLLYMKISDVKKSDILRLYSSLYTEKGIAINTIHTYQGLLHPAFQMAVDDDIIRKNPCENCMKDFKAGCKTKKFALTTSQQENLLFFLQNSKVYSKYYEFIALMLYTGLRISEAKGLTWDNIDFKEKKITVDHQLIYGKIDGHYRFYDAPPKNKKTRYVPMLPVLVSMLKEYKEKTYFLNSSFKLQIGKYSHFIFLNSKGNPYVSTNFGVVCHNICNAYNKLEKKKAQQEGREPILFPDFTSHVLRHTFCTEMAKKGMDPKVLQMIMGHSDISVTMDIYNHADDYERLSKEMERVNKVIEC